MAQLLRARCTKVQEVPTSAVAYVLDEDINEAVHHALSHHDAAQPESDLIARFWAPPPDPTSESGKHVHLTNVATTARKQDRKAHITRDVIKDFGAELQRHALQHADTILAQHAEARHSLRQQSFISTTDAQEALKKHWRNQALQHHSVLHLSQVLLQLLGSNDKVLVSDMEAIMRMALDRVEAWAQLDALDPDDTGTLSYQQVHSFVHATAERLGYLPAGALGEQWKIVAPRKIFFLLGNSSNRVSTRALIVHSLVDEILAYEAASDFPAQRLDWFAPDKTAAIVDRFKQLSNGNASPILFPEQLMHVRTAHHQEDGHVVSTMALFFAQRVFEVHVRGVCPVTGRPAMQLAEFADFLLAWNFRGELPSTKYFFRVLDVEHTGRLSAAVVHMWCRLVHEVAVHKMACLFPYNPEDVKDEIFDMVKPKNPDGLSLADLMGSHLSDTICGMLVDGQCHHDYDQREALMHQQPEDEY